MIVINTKSFEELSQEGTENLAAVGFTTKVGSVAKMFINVISSLIAEFYNALERNHNRAFISSTDGEAMDEIGALLNCERPDDDVYGSDENYRKRITEQTHILASSNLRCLESQVRMIDGVKDFKFYPQSMGAGSFSAIIIYEPYDDRDKQAIYDDVMEALWLDHGYGIRFNIIEPVEHIIKIRQQLAIREDISDIEKQEIRYRAQEGLIDYITNLSIGDTFVPDKVTQIMLNASPEGYVTEESNIDFFIDGRRAFWINQYTRWFERFAIDPSDVESVVVL